MSHSRITIPYPFLGNPTTKGARDRAGTTLRFTIPTVVNGRVSGEANGEIDV